MRHVVDSSSLADWTGITITRDAEWDGDALILVLTANVVFGGKPGEGTLRWQKPEL